MSVSATRECASLSHKLEPFSPQRVCSRTMQWVQSHHTRAQPLSPTPASAPTALQQQLLILNKQLSSLNQLLLNMAHKERLNSMSANSMPHFKDHHQVTQFTVTSKQASEEDAIDRMIADAERAVSILSIGRSPTTASIKAPFSVINSWNSLSRGKAPATNSLSSVQTKVTHSEGCPLEPLLFIPPKPKELRPREWIYHASPPPPLIKAKMPNIHIDG